MGFIKDVLGSTFVGDALTSGDAEKDAAKAQQQGYRAAIDEQRAARESFEQRVQPFSDIGLSAASPLMDLLNLQDQPAIEGEYMPAGQDGLLQEISPLVSFLRQEGFEDIQESAAARGKLRSGGTLKDLAKFNTQLTSTIVPKLQEQKFNQLFNVLGLGQSSAVGQGQAALQTGGNIGNFQAGIGQSRAGGILGAENAKDQTRSDIAGLLGGMQGGAFTPPPQTFGGF